MLKLLTNNNNNYVTIMPINKCIDNITKYPSKQIMMFMSNYTNMQYEIKCVFSRRLKLVRLSHIDARTCLN